MTDSTQGAVPIPVHDATLLSEASAVSSPPNGGGPTAAHAAAQPSGHGASRRYELAAHEWWVAGAVGLWLGCVGVAAFTAGIWAWAIADRVGANSVSVRWLGPDFTATAATSALVLAVVGGVTGSFVHVASLFTSRVGRRTFETSYFWWYLLRPVEAALLAMVFVAALRSGLVALGTGTADSSTAVLSFLAGGLAGLFTDRVMQRLRGLLGATKTDQKASEQPAPGTSATS